MVRKKSIPGSKEKVLKPCGFRTFVAAGEGFEPSHTESESAVLPLHKPAIFVRSCRTNRYYYTGKQEFVKGFFEISRYTAAKGPYYGKSKLFIACKHGLAAHIRAQRFGYEHTVMLAVKAKVVFKDASYG